MSRSDAPATFVSGRGSYGDGQVRQAWAPLFHAAASPRSASRRDVVRVFFRHPKLILGCFAIVTAIVIGGQSMLPSNYESEAKVLIRTDNRLGPAFFSGIASFRDEPSYASTMSRLETEMQLVATLPAALAIVDRLQLTPEQVYYPPVAHFAKAAVGAYGWFRLRLLNRPAGPPDVRRDVAEALRASITVVPVASKAGEGLSNVVSVSLRASDPLVSRDALSAVLESYLAMRATGDAASAEAAARLLEREVEESGQALRRSEEALRAFVATQGTAGRPAPLTGARLDEGLDRRLSQLAELELRLLEAREKYVEQSEPVQSLRREFDQLRSAIGSHVARGAAADERFTQLSRELASRDERHGELRRRLSEVQLFGAVTANSLGDRVVIEPPMLPTSSDWKSRVIFSVAGAFLGLVIGVGLAGFAELTDNRLRSKDDIVRYLGIDPLGAVSRLPANRLPALVQRGQRLSEREEQDRVKLRGVSGLAARLVASFETRDGPPRGGARVVLVTSARGREGKSLIAQLIAEQLARQGYGRVLIMRDMASADHLSTSGAERALPASERLNSAILVDEWLVPTGNGAAGSSTSPSASAVGTSGAELDRPNVLQVSPQLRIGNLPVAAYLSGVRVYSFLARLASRYDWIVLDGDVIGGGDVQALAQCAGAVVVVVDASKTSRATVQDALGVLRVEASTQVSVVLNKVSQEIPSALYERL